MNWQLALASSIFTYSIVSILQRVLLKDEDSDPIAYFIVIQLLTGIIIGIYAILKGFHLPDLTKTLPNIILMTFLYGAGSIALYSSLKKVEVSEFTILFSTRAIWAFFAAIFFLKETFSLNHAAGTVLILLSTILVSWRGKRVKFSSGQTLAFFAAIAYGFAFVNDAFVLRSADLPSYLCLTFILPGLAVWAVNPQSTSKMTLLLKKATFEKLGTPTLVYIASIMMAISYIMLFLSYQIGRNATQIAPLQQSVTVVTVLLGIILLKERADLWKKIAGAVLSFIGILFLI